MASSPSEPFRRDSNAGAFALTGATDDAPRTLAETPCSTAPRRLSYHTAEGLSPESIERIEDGRIKITDDLGNALPDQNDPLHSED